MNYKHYIIIKHNRPYYRPVIEMDYSKRRLRLGEASDDGMPFALNEALAINRILKAYGYDSLVWSQGKELK